jgi:Tfp pilus assembly protein PilN
MRAVNLIPGDQRKGAGSIAGRSGGAALIVLAMIVGVAILAAMYGGAARQISKETGEVAKIEAQTIQARARTGRLTPYTSFVSMAEQRTKTVAQLVQARFDWSHTLHELGRVLPSGTALEALAGTVGTPSGGPSSSASAGATPVSSTPPGSVPSIALTGCATSQSEVAQTLQRLKLIDGVTDVHLQSSTESGGAAVGGSGGGCPAKDPTFSITVTFAGLPSTPVPSVTPSMTASTASSKTAPHAAQIAAQAKGVHR